MAIQAGPVYFVGTRDDVIGYKMGYKYYMRSKPSLTGKEVKTGKRYVRTMQSAGRLARGSKIASKIYAALPEDWKYFGLYRAFVGEAVLLIKAGKTDEEVYNVLYEKHLAEFEPGYREEDEFVHRDVLTNRTRRVQHGYKIDKMPAHRETHRHVGLTNYCFTAAG